MTERSDAPHYRKPWNIVLNGTVSWAVDADGNPMPWKVLLDAVNALPSERAPTSCWKCGLVFPTGAFECGQSPCGAIVGQDGNVTAKIGITPRKEPTSPCVVDARRRVLITAIDVWNLSEISSKDVDEVLKRDAERPLP